MLSLVFTALSDPVPKRDLLQKPPMGWNSLYAYGSNVTQKLVRHNAEAFIKLGLKQYGYEYVMINDGYMIEERDTNGSMIMHKWKFPNGMNHIANFIHDLGLKVGIEQTDGTKTCLGYAGSFSMENIDAADYDKWGIDWLKYNHCYNPIEASFFSPDIGNITVNGKEFLVANAQLIGKAIIQKTGFVGFIGNKEGEVIFDIPVDETGKYTVVIRYL